ncbi:hypothetical protein A9Q84_08820 [Halobacteriovorax marinus]|uniref:Lipoprotein n=1 Tax=Halobacteriovorax marinus TaxID=97084 RepID=A0A1Y5F6S6_9BACT|nr:hypothetical protein A9Q84_08820 [Halobacteriovorax marinus]
MNKITSILMLCFLLTSCGGSKEDKVDNAILRANLALTRGDCQTAISILELQGRQTLNDIYLKTLASSYACRAGYKTTVLFATDIPKVTDAALLLRGLSTFTTSPNDSFDNLEYVDLQVALDILLYAGGTLLSQNPTSAIRDEIFGNAGQDINAFGFYLSFAQLGKFSYFYGNASAVTGIKGTGGVTSTNPCYLDYNANVNAFLTALSGAGLPTGVCAAGSDDGHPDLVSGVDTVDAARACEGIVGFNNMVDTLDSFIASSTSGDFGNLIGIKTAVDVVEALILVAKPTFDTAIFDTTSQDRCELLFAGNDEDIMYFYAGIFETLHR